MATLTLDALIADRHFTLDGYIIGNRVRHDRTIDHTGVEDTTTVTLSTAIGPYPAGTTVQIVLADLMARLVSLDAGVHSVAHFTLDAVIAAYFSLNAVIYRPTSATFTLDAAISLSGPGTFTLNAALIKPATSATFTLNGFVV